MMTSWLDGFDMSKTLKKDPEFENTPILMLTGIKDKIHIDFQPKEGGPEWYMVDTYMEKPVAPDVLLAEVEKLLAKKE